MEVKQPWAAVWPQDHAGVAFTGDTSAGSAQTPHKQLMLGTEEENKMPKTLRKMHVCQKSSDAGVPGNIEYLLSNPAL